MRVGNTTLTYDNSENPTNRYNVSSFTTYYYVLNLQGDVVKLVNAGGTAVATYTYNAWGEVLTATGSMASINPFRYRGYYYDTETGFYYLQSRYYDPVTHRFINADSFASTGQGFVGTNMFAYCLNNPVMRYDPLGTESIIDLISFLVERIKNAINVLAECAKPDYDRFLDALGMRESSNDYSAVNRYGYMGRYQMGSYALQDAGFQNSSGEWTDLANSYGVYSDADF